MPPFKKIGVDKYGILYYIIFRKNKLSTVFRGFVCIIARNTVQVKLKVRKSATIGIPHNFGVLKMCKMYSVIEALCAERGIKPGKVCADLKISRGIIGDLKAGRTKTLSAKNLKAIADYFSVSIDYLLGNVSDPFFQLYNEQIARDINSYEEDPDLDQQLSGIDFALSGEIHDLTDNEKQDILDYIRFKKSQRGGGDK